MNSTSPAASVLEEVRTWPGVSTQPTPRGSTAIVFEGRELGHVHPDRGTLDFPLSDDRCAKVLAAARAKEWPPADMSIGALPTGTYETPAIFAFRGGSWNDTRHFASTAVLVHHLKGNVLIDTGFAKHIDAHLKLIPWIQRSPHSKGVPAVDQLASGGIQPGALAGVIPTHTHWDHVSGLDDLGGGPVMVNAQGKRWIDTNAKGTEVINSFRGLNYKPYDFEGGPYLGFPRSHDLWGDGSVVIVPAPGHTPDSVVMFVNLPSGTRYVLVGDLVWQMEGLEIPAEKPWPLRRLIGEDDDEVRQDIARIRSARKRYPQIHPIPAHDASAFRMIPVFPASSR